MKYRICWKSKKTGSINGQGEPIFNSREAAQATIDDLNKTYPLIEHWIEEVDDEQARRTD